MSNNANVLHLDDWSLEHRRPVDDAPSPCEWVGAAVIAMPHAVELHRQMADRVIDLFVGDRVMAVDMRLDKLELYFQLHATDRDAASAEGYAVVNEVVAFAGLDRDLVEAIRISGSRSDQESPQHPSLTFVPGSDD